MKIIARIHNAFDEKFGVPRQSGLAEEVISTIVFEEEFRAAEALRGIEEFSHLWLIWAFDRAERETWSPTVRPPRLGGNKRVGVFATRSPFRPNAIGLSCVRLLGVEKTPEGHVLKVAGADLVNGTPIYDIKPYVEYADSHPGARSGFTESSPWETLEVVIPDGVDTSAVDVESLRDILSLDPRPSYHNDPSKEYGMSFGGREVRFRVVDKVLTVISIS